MRYCDNVITCGNEAAPGKSKCYSCLNSEHEEHEARQQPHIDKRLRQLESKPHKPNYLHELDLEEK